MTTINSEKFAEICSGVWHDRAAVLTGRGFLSGEAALVRAVYWRLCKSGVSPAGTAECYGSLQTIAAYRLGVSSLLEINARPCFDGRPFLEDLLRRYAHENETGYSEETK